MKTELWQKFLTALARLLAFIFPPALALAIAYEADAFMESSVILSAIFPAWASTIIVHLRLWGRTVAPYMLAAAIVLIACVTIGPKKFTARIQILWQAGWIFFIFSVILFLTQIADPEKISGWRQLAALTFTVINGFAKLSRFNSYVGIAAGTALIYSLIIYLKDFIGAFLLFGAGFLDRRLKPILIDELKAALGLRLIRTGGDLIPVAPAMVVLIIIVFIIGAIPLYLANRVQSPSLVTTFNFLGAAILFYGFVQICAIFLIFLTGLVYYLVRKEPPEKPKVPPLSADFTRRY